MAVSASFIPMAGAACTRALGIHLPLQLNLSFSSANSTTKAKPPLLRFKTANPSPHLFFSPPSQSHPHKYRVAGDVGGGPEEEGNEEDENEGEQENSRLYVGNLPYSLTESQLADIFQEAGRVDAVEVVYDRVTDRSRGFAFVTMDSVEEAKEAIRMLDGSQVGGRTVKVNFPEVPRGGEREVMVPRMQRSNRGFIDSPYKVYAGNLGWGLTSEALQEAFQGQPGLLSAKVIYDRDCGRSRGFGFVSFASPEDAESAVNAMNGVEVEGRPLRLNLAAGREKATVAAAPYV